MPGYEGVNDGCNEFVKKHALNKSSRGLLRTVKRALTYRQEVKSRYMTTYLKMVKEVNSNFTRCSNHNLINVLVIS